ncbi:MAG TPA: hypothetical protein VNN18_12755 [Candidatus Xenobia bacterium]|nr:hypothetical protein [Candidatus Xenobia bacterium]
MRLDNWFQSERGGALKVILLILAGLLLLVMIAAVIGVQMLREYVKFDLWEREDKVAVSTPVGEFSLESAGDAARRLRLPVYPGATPTGDGIAMKMRADVDDQPAGFSLAMAKFFSTDSIDKIDAWYRRELGPEFIREKGRVVEHDPGESGDKWAVPKVEPGGSDIVYKYERKDHVRVVTLVRKGSQVGITLMEVHPVEGQ